MLSPIKLEARKHANEHVDALPSQPLGWSNAEWREYLIYYGRIAGLRYVLKNIVAMQKKMT